MQTNEEATVYVHDIDLFVTVQILEGTPAVLSLGKLCEDQGHSNEWTSGQKPHLREITEQSKETQKTTYRSLSEDYQLVLPVRLQVPLLHRYGDSNEDSSSSPASIRRRSTSSPVLGDQLIDFEQFAGDSKDTDPVKGNLLHDLPEWLEDFTEI